jgi:hypothetical protein
MKTVFLQLFTGQLFVVSLWLCADAMAGHKPEGLQPNIFVARMVDRETVQFSWYSEKTITVEKSVNIEVEEKTIVYTTGENGKLETEVVKEVKPREINYSAEEPLREAIRSKVKIDQLIVYTAQGQEVSPDKLPQLLKQPVPVVVSSNRSIVDPFYLSIFNKGTLVFISRDPGFPTVVSRPLPPPAETESQPSASSPD